MPEKRREPTRAIYLDEELYTLLRTIVMRAEREPFDRMMNGTDPVTRAEGQRDYQLVVDLNEAILAARFPMDDREPGHRPRRGRVRRRKESE